MKTHKFEPTQSEQVKIRERYLYTSYELLLQAEKFAEKQSLLQVENTNPSEGGVIDTYANNPTAYDATNVDTEKSSFSDPVLSYIQDAITDGVVLKVEEGRELINPIYVRIQANDEGVSVLRHKIKVGDRANAQIVFIADQTMTAAVVQTLSIELGKEARLCIYSMHKGQQQAWFSYYEAVQAEKSSLSLNLTNIHQKSAFNSLKVDLMGENSVCDVRGISIGTEDEVCDNQVEINHRVPNCRSNQLMKHLLSDTSKGAFSGRIHVDVDAQGTEAYQRSANMVLSDNSRMYMRPQLEIYADDVKCSHGATVGQPDQEALFYLRSRGVSLIDAKRLLLEAFVGEVTAHYEDSQMQLYTNEQISQVLTNIVL